MITICFSIYIATYLDPTIADISIDTYMTFIGSIGTLIPGTNSNYRTIRGETDWISRKIKNICPIYITTYLEPTIADILIDTYMTAIIPIVVIIPFCTNSDYISVIRETYITTWLIPKWFSIDICTNLNPSIIDVLIDSYITVTTVILGSTNSDYISVSRKTNWLSKTFWSPPINITTYLSPSIIYIFIDLYITTTTMRSPNSNYRTISR